MGIALVFVFCQCFTIIPDIDELICTISGSKCQDIIYTYNIIEFGHLMLAVNSSVNFVFYIIHIPLLKEEIKKVPKHINRNNLSIRNINSRFLIVFELKVVSFSFRFYVKIQEELEETLMAAEKIAP